MTGNILILSAGRRVSLVKAFMTEAALQDASIKVFTADADPSLSSACQVSDASFRVPRINDLQFIPSLEKYCTDQNVKIIIPTIDTELLILSQNKKKFEEKGIYIMVPDEELVTICRNKRKTHAFFFEKGIDVAKELDCSDLSFPLFVKPEDGSSSNHIYFIPDKDHLPPFILKEKRFMLLEYLDRKVYNEFTADTYFNKEGSICCVVPRKRIETRGGEISKGVTTKNFLRDWIKEKFNRLPGARGCITMQFFVHSETDEVRGIEINPRFGGGYPLSYLAGANYPKWIISEYIYNQPVSWFSNWEDNLLMLRHDNEIIVHGYKHQ
jgi:carbamoyl-phosphate synthase large subunit